MAANPDHGPGTERPGAGRDGAGAQDAPGTADGRNGQLSWDGYAAGPPGGRQAGPGHTSTGAAPGSEDTEAFSPPPHGSGRSGPAVTDEAFYEEEGPDFDDEDDRHL
jgi:hypothetical protein